MANINQKQSGRPANPGESVPNKDMNNKSGQQQIQREVARQKFEERRGPSPEQGKRG